MPSTTPSFLQKSNQKPLKVGVFSTFHGSVFGKKFCKK
nr:MAG TPA: hypothetical protein [Caudoviricetes sp.]